MTTPQPKPNPLLTVHRKIHPGFGTENAVYGTILVSGLIAVSSAHGASSAKVLLTLVVTVLVFWGAHVYAGTVARVGTRISEDSEERYHVRQAFLRSLKHSIGMLGACVIPVSVLLLGTTKMIPDHAANEVALWSGVIILGSLGYIALLRRGSSVFQCILSALATASFGVIFVVLKAFVH